MTNPRFTLQTRAALEALHDVPAGLLIDNGTPNDIWNGCQILKRDGLVTITEVRYSGRQGGKKFIVHAVDRTTLVMHIHLSEQEMGI